MIITYIHATLLEDQIRTQIRCRNFVDAINRTGLHRANLLEMDAFIQNSAVAQKMCAESDILVIYRYLFGSIFTAIQYWKAREKKVIVDFDQAINYLTPEMPGYSFWVEGAPLANHGYREMHVDNKIDPPALEQFKWGLGMVDAATVPSARLADDWAQYTTIYEVPDYLNTSQYPISPKYDQNEIWIGLGQNTQFSSFINSGLCVAMEKICKQYPQVRLAICEQKNNGHTRLNIDPAQMVIYSPYEFDEWMNILLKLDMGLAPIYGHFDQRIGPINLLEFMIAKIPWVATEQLTFHELTQYGTWVQNSPGEWETAIHNIVSRLDVYQKKAIREPFLFALCQDVRANIDKVLRVYAGIIAQSSGKGVL